MSEQWNKHDDRASFWLVFVLGAATMVFGIVLLAWPDATVRVLGVFVGIWFMSMGLARILTAFIWLRGLARTLLSGIVGILLVIGGVACIRDVAKGVTVLAFMVSLAWLFSGLAEFVAALHSTGSTRRWRGALSVASFGIGFVFLLWPGPSLTLLMVLIGATALLAGAAEVVFAFHLRRQNDNSSTGTGGSAGVSSVAGASPYGWGGGDSRTEVAPPWPNNSSTET